MKCSKCGYVRQTEDILRAPATECPLCGMAFEASPVSSGFNPSVTLPELKRPSPLDSESLKKARERVEMRLRKQLEKKMRDQRHQETLERGRKISAVNMQKRLSQKEQTESEKHMVDKTDQPEKSDPPSRKEPPVLQSAPDEHLPSAPDECAAQPESEPLRKMAQPVMGIRAKSRSGSGLARLLSLTAWLILCAGLVGAVLSYTTISVQADVARSTEYGQHALPLGLLLGFAYLATGVLGFAFFWVSSLISGQLKEIRRLLLSPQPERTRSTELQ